MMFLFVLLAVCVAIPDSTKKAFIQFKKEHNKVYESKEEESFRLGIFHANLADIEAKNERARLGGSSAVYGVNFMSDLSAQEFKDQYLMKPEKRPSLEEMKKQRKEQGIVHEEDVSIPLAGIPSSIDWRAKGGVTPVKNQGQCGSCWAFSATEEIESAMILAGKATASTIKLAPQQIVDCSTADAGCGGGRTEDAYNYVIAFGGLESNNTYPYKAVDGVCHNDKSKVVAKIQSFSYATTFWSQSKMLKSLSEKPVSVCLDAASWQHYKSGVMTSWECDDYINLMDHCVQAVGYNQEGSDPYYMVRNSWTTKWGLDGYIKLSLSTWNTCGILADATVVQLA